jgi:hypothetical protein
MNCEKLHEFFLRKNISELSSQEYDLIQKHIVTCHNCKEYLEKITKAEDYLIGLSKTEPTPINDEFMADSILSILSNQNKTLNPNSFIYEFFNWFQKDLVRYAIIALLFSIISFYGYQEYYTAKRIYALEKQLSQNTENNPTNAAISTQLINANWIYGLYKYLNGANCYWEVKGNVIVINKSNLKTLLMDYNKLSVEEQNEIVKMKKQLFPELMDKQVSKQGDLIINNMTLEKQLKLLNNKGGNHEK